MNKCICFITSICAMLILASCGGGSDEEPSRTLTLEVADYKSPCYGLIPYMCLNVRKPGESSYGGFDNIAGFSPQWGHRYVVDVRETKVVNPPADASNLKYELLRIQQDAPVTAGARFSVLINPLPAGASPYISTSNETGGKFVDGTPFLCASGQTCLDLIDRLSRNVTATLTFSYSSPTTLPLVLQNVQ